MEAVGDIMVFDSKTSQSSLQILPLLALCNAVLKVNSHFKRKQVMPEIVLQFQTISPNLQLVALIIRRF